VPACLSVDHDCEPCKNGQTDQLAIPRVDLVGPVNHVLEPDAHEKRQF